MRITAEPVHAEELQPGDLFSSAGPEYWDNVPRSPFIVGERVYIRVPTPCPDDQRGELVYRITITAD